MRYLHTMLRVRDLAASLDFFGKLGLREARRQENQAGRFTLVFLSSGAPEDSAEIELTYNWDQAEPYPTGRFFGHLAYEVDDIYQFCERISAAPAARRAHGVHQIARRPFGRAAPARRGAGEARTVDVDAEPRRVVRMGFGSVAQIGFMSDTIAP
jgi:lactoylglutathione lyase